MTLQSPTPPHVEPDSPLKWILLSQVAELEGAVGAMLAADAKQQKLRGKHPDAYDEHFHAAGIASHLQSICTGLEDLLSRAGLPHEEHRPPLNAQAVKALLAFRDDLYQGKAGAHEPSRVFELARRTSSAVHAVAESIRALFGSPSSSVDALRRAAAAPGNPGDLPLGKHVQFAPDLVAQARAIGRRTNASCSER